MSGSASGYLLSKPLSRTGDKRPNTEVTAGYTIHFQLGALCFYSLVQMALSGPKSFIKTEQYVMLSDKADKSKLSAGKKDMLGQYRKLTRYVASRYMRASCTVICDASAAHFPMQKNSPELIGTSGLLFKRCFNAGKRQKEKSL